MNWDGNNIEDLFKESFQDYKMTPELSVWNRIERQLAFKQFFKFKPTNFNAYYLGATLILLSVVLFQFSKFENKTITTLSESEKQTFIENKLQTEVKTNLQETDILETNFKQTNSIANGNKLSVSKTNIPKKETICTFDSSKVSSNEIEYFELITYPATNGIGFWILNDSTSDIESSKLEHAVSQSQGCEPLTVHCSINKKNAKRIAIDFGNGIVSDEYSASTVYSKAGIYTLTIELTDANENVHTILDTITVFEAPKPIALIDADTQCTENCIVYFYNYTNGAHKYMWDFGDENFSRLKDPVHIYNQTGKKRIKLTVWSDKMCADSIFLESPFKMVNENFVVFPNAFIPSESGSNNGFYTLSNYSTDIFYPVAKGVAEYKLEIYNRSGLLLFQTTDVNQGWDGYYKYQLMPQNVYIWKVSGKYQNQEAFELAGDVTLIRK